jgi:phage-related protein
LAVERKRIPAHFYRTESGSEPVREWLKSLGKQERFLIGTNIKTVEYGWPIGMPICRPIGNALYEVRTNLQGNRIARVLFCIMRSEMLLLHGFIKKTRKTPKSDLTLAIGRKRRFEKEQ